MQKIINHTKIEKEESGYQSRITPITMIFMGRSRWVLITVSLTALFFPLISLPAKPTAP